MLKFIKGHMGSIAGIEIFPLISFLIFFLFFMGLLWWVVKLDKKSVSEISALPLESNSDQNL